MRIGTWVAVGLFALQAAACVPGRPSQLPGPTEFPIRRVVLYQNGVGYFERAGHIDGEGVTLQVRPSQINDLLKSLTVIDTGGGRVVSVSLPLEQTGDRTLRELPPQVRRAGGLLEVLRLFRGARIELVGDYGAHLSGRVLGVENLQPSSESAPADWRVSLKTDEDEVQVLSLSEIRSVKLLDRTLSVGLDRSLDVSLGEGGWKPIELAIRLTGEQPHQLLASYVVEMPRWKPAYRLVLEPDAQPLLQGWAVVDNVSGEDWNDVQLSLVSGSPISFRYNLHAPQYAERVDRTPVGLPRAAAPPPSEQAGYVEGEASAPFDMLEDIAESEEVTMKTAARKMHRSKTARRGVAHAEASRTAASSAPMEAFSFGASPPRPAIRADTLQSQGSSAAGVSAGALFRYDIADPLTIADRSSTLVNIVNQRIEGQEVAYFRPELSRGSSETHPYRAVKLVNGTQLMLEKGPITVYSAGTFVGEGFVERMPQGATSFLTFAVDAKLTLNEHGGMREDEYRLLRIVNGQLLTEAQRVRTTTYEVKSRRDEPVRAYIRTLRESGWDMDNPPPKTVETPHARIVPLDVAAKGSAQLTLSWKQAVRRTISIDSGNAVELLRVYLGGGNVPPALAQTLRAVLKVKEQMAQQEQERRRLDKRHRDLTRDQARVRANLKVLRKTKGNVALQRQLSNKLAQQEGQLGKISGQTVRLSEQLAELEAQLKSLMAQAAL